MPATSIKKITRKMQRGFNDISQDVNSFISNVHKLMTQTPKFLNSLMNNKHKSRRKHRTR